MEVNNLRQSCQQVEDAFTQGMEKLHSTLAETVAACQLVGGGYIPRMPTEMEKLEALVSFVNQLMELHPIISSKGMNSSSTEFVTPSRFGIYEPIHHLGTWGENFKSNDNPNTSTPMIMDVDTKLDAQSKDTSHGMFPPSTKYEHEASKPLDKIQRHLAQNREVARKSRLWKKGSYIVGGVEGCQMGFCGPVNPGIAAFEMEHGHWVEEQTRQICELSSALQAHISDLELHILVEGGLSHYVELFRMKSTAAKANVFYIMSGMWRTAAERFFFWIGGFRPSELLKVLGPHLATLTESQNMEVNNLRQSCQQAEDALTQGMEKLQSTLAETVAAGRLVEGGYIPRIPTAMEKLEALVSFVNQADHLRQEILQQMSRILTTRQAARGLLALGEYFQRLRALSSIWATRPREPA